MSLGGLMTALGLELGMPPEAAAEAAERVESRTTSPGWKLTWRRCHGLGPKDTPPPQELLMTRAPLLVAHTAPRAMLKLEYPPGLNITGMIPIDSYQDDREVS